MALISRSAELWACQGGHSDWGGGGHPRGFCRLLGTMEGVLSRCLNVRASRWFQHLDMESLSQQRPLSYGPEDTQAALLCPV